MKNKLFLTNPLLFISVLASILNFNFFINAAQARKVPTNRQLKRDNLRLKTIPKPVNISESLNTNDSSLGAANNWNHKPQPQNNVELSTIPVKPVPLIANSFRGKASWYGSQFHGRLTASGEIFNQNDFTAAHPQLSFGTKVQVTNLNNGRSVIVRINDRGPFVKNRLIDLSTAAARSIGMISSGVAPVKITILGQ